MTVVMRCPSTGPRPHTSPAMCGFSFAMSSSCLKCNKPFDPFAASAAPDGMHVDHAVPSSKGGVDHLSNYQPLCTRCNTSKASSLTTSTRRNGKHLPTNSEPIDI